MVVDLNDRNSLEEKRQSVQANLAFWLNFLKLLLFFYWRIFVLHTLVCLILQYTKHMLGKLCSTTWLLPPVLQISAQCYFINAAAAAKSCQSCPTLCNPIEGSPPGSSVHGILQARTRVGCHFLLQHKKVKSESEVAQSCPTLQDPMDCNLPSSSVHGIFQARVLEWVAIAFSDFINEAFSDHT